MRRCPYVIAALICLLSVSTVAEAQSQGFKTHTQKYREKNPSGKGRAGGATLAVRMLYAKAGTTLLEVTTGEFDGPAAPTGTLTKVRLTAYDGNGVEILSSNYQPTGGSYFSQNFTGLWPGQSFTVQAHIRTDAKKNTPVTVTATVQKRPDLFAERIAVPVRVPVNIPIQVVGVISELNGQTGARTECVLYADNVEVDRGSAIWVDSGDSVSCAFSPTFPATGVVNLKLAAVSVVPGDWDAANNAVERRIEVMPLTPDYDGAFGEAVSIDIDKTGFLQTGRYVNSTAGTGFDWYYEETVNRKSDVFVYSAASVQIPYVPSLLTATVTDDAGGGWSMQRQVPGCFDHSVGRANGRSFYTYVTGCGNLYVEVGSYAGTVTYASQALTRTFHVVGSAAVYDGPAQYVLNTTETEIEDGENLLKGGVWTVNVAVVIGPYEFSAPLSIPLNQPFDAGETLPYVCESTATTYTCNSSGWRQAGRFGVAEVIRQQP